MNMRRVIQLLCVGVMIFLLSGPVFALNEVKEAPRIETQELIQPLFTHIVLFQNNFDIASNGQVSVSSYLTARNVDSLRINISLQRYSNNSWTTIKSWSNTANGTSMGLSGSHYVTKGYSYRMVSSGVVYRSGSQVESAAHTSSSKYY